MKYCHDCLTPINQYKKENDFNVKKEFCSRCGTKLGFFRQNPKTKWNVEGQLCKECWDFYKAEQG